MTGACCNLTHFEAIREAKIAPALRLFGTIHGRGDVWAVTTYSAHSSRM